MLDLVLRDVGFRYRRGFVLEDISLTGGASTACALTGPPASGTSTLARIIAGDLTPERGAILIGKREVTRLARSRRPLLFVTSTIDVPGRWSVEHALINAVRTRKLDRIDRRREFLLAVEAWELPALLERRVDSLSDTERARVQLARIDLLRPALLVADRLLERVSPSARVVLADALFRTLRVHGTTVVTVPSSHEELAFSDAIAVLDAGRVVQSGSVAEVHRRPLTRAAAVATGECDEVPIRIRGNEVSSPIGSWTVDAAPFQGAGVAVVRPSHFAAAARGEESDMIFGVEEAGVAAGRWLARGLVSGATSLRVELPIDAAGEGSIHKGKLFPLRYDPRNFLLLPRNEVPPENPLSRNGIPSLADSR